MKRLRSECGNFYAERCGDTWHRIYDASGVLLGETTWWSNMSDNVRLRFKTGFDGVEAIFSYRRYPSWFFRRWVIIFKIEKEELFSLIEKAGGEVLVYFKPSMNCWHHVGFRGNAQVAGIVDVGLKARGVEVHKTNKCRGFNIECPDQHEETS